MTADSEKWLGKLRKLNPNVSKAKGEGKARFAPHKPLLLLCVIDLAEAGALQSAHLAKTPELRLRFDSYWRIVDPRWGGKPNLDLPFFHLSRQGFWTPRAKDGRVADGPDGTASVRLDAGFLEALHDREWRDMARRILVETWFPDVEQAALYVALGFTDAKVRRLGYRVKDDTGDYQAKGRDARFRVVVVTQYRFTCSLTGYGLHTRRGGSIVEAAHIHQFSKSRNDSPDNGLALTRDAHWMFDEGLWTVDPRNRIMVASELFTEWGPDARWLKSRHGQELHFLEGASLRPAAQHLGWHRANVFAG
ncbi:MAG: HNH endonuclease [Chthoniobacterales bacterium]